MNKPVTVSKPHTSQDQTDILKAHKIERDRHPISRKFISDNALKVMRHLNRSGFEAYLVGGAVRDMMLNLQPKDFDVATNATPEEIRKLFKNARIIGRRFRIVHVLFGKEIIEVTTFRGHHNSQENENHSNHSSLSNDQGMLLRDNVFGSVEEDALRRDFTVNALYYSSKDFCVYDFVNGMQDIQHKTLRLIGDPLMRFKEDPVRILRALRFAAKLQFTLDKDTLAEIDNHADLLSLIPAARLFDEFIKLFISGHAVETYYQLKEHHLLKFLIHSSDNILANPIHEALIQQAFINTDQRLGIGKSINTGFIFSVLLWPALCKAKAEFEQDNLTPFAALQAAAQSVLQEQSQLTSLPKHIQTGIKEIWELQDRLENRHGRRAFKLLEHPKFRAAYDFLLLREEVGEIESGLGEWWTSFQIQDETAREQSVRDLGASTSNRQKKPRKRKAKIS
jgi:poly(A) polymerase